LVQADTNTPYQSKPNSTMEEVKSVLKTAKSRRMLANSLFSSITICCLAIQTVTPALAQYSYGSSAAYGLVRMVPMMLTRAVRGSQNPNRQSKNNNNSNNNNQNQSPNQNPNMQNQQGQPYPGGQAPYGQPGFNNNMQGQGQVPYGQQNAQGFPQQQPNQSVFGNVQGQNFGAQGGQAPGSFGGGNATFGSGQQQFQGVPNGQAGYPGQAAPSYGAQGGFGQQAQPGAF
jgi:hypothetical protein